MFLRRREDLDGLGDLLRTPDDGVEFAGLGLGGQVAAELVERRRGALPLPLAALTTWTAARLAASRRFAGRLQHGAGEQLGGGALAVGGDADEDVLGADVADAGFGGLLLGVPDGGAQARAEALFVGVFGQRREDVRHLRRDGVGVEVELAEHPAPRVVGGRRIEHVLGGHLGVVPLDGSLGGVGEQPLGVVGQQAVEVDPLHGPLAGHLPEEAVEDVVERRPGAHRPLRHGVLRSRGYTVPRSGLRHSSARCSTLPEHSRRGNPFVVTCVD